MGVTNFSGLNIGSGSDINLVKMGTIAVNPASCADGAAVEVTLTITGAAAGDIVVMCPPAAGLTAGLINGGAHVSAADTVKLRIANLSGGTVDEASATWSYCIIRP